MTKTIDEILGLIPDELRNKLRIDVDENEFSVMGLETIIIVRNPVDIVIHENKSGETLYSIVTKNAGEFIVSSSGATFATIV